jgi:iron(III) transport system ATP-binding protein
MVFQDYALFPNMTVAQNIAFGLKNKSEAQARINELLALASIPELANRFPSELSGGQQQRVALIRALAPKPKLLLLDEPFANVDAHLKTQLGQALRHVLKQEQASAIFITHDQRDALSLSDQLGVMTMTPNGATIAQVDSPEAVYLHPRSPTVASLTGATQFIHTHAADSQVKIFGQFLPLAQPVSGPITLLIRPEQLEFIEDEAGAMTVTRIAFQGTQRELLCTHSEGTIKVHHHVRTTDGARGYVKARMPLFAWPGHVLTMPKA